MLVKLALWFWKRHLQTSRINNDIVPLLYGSDIVPLHYGADIVPLHSGVAQEKSKYTLEIPIIFTR